MSNKHHEITYYEAVFIQRGNRNVHAYAKAPKVVPNQIVNPNKIKCPENVNTLHVTQYDKANQMLDT